MLRSTSGVFDCEIPNDSCSFNLTGKQGPVIRASLKHPIMRIRVFDSVMDCEFTGNQKDLVCFCRDLLEFCGEVFGAEVCDFGLPKEDTQRLVLMNILVKVFGFTIRRDESGVYLRGDL